MTLYEEIGGEASIDAALDKFYPKILGDPRVSLLFEGIDMARLRKFRGELIRGSREVEAGLFFRVAILGLWLESLEPQGGAR